MRYDQHCNRARHQLLYRDNYFVGRLRFQSACRDVYKRQPFDRNMGVLFYAKTQNECRTRGAALIAVGVFISSLTENQGFAAGIGLSLIHI